MRGAIPLALLSSVTSSRKTAKHPPSRAILSPGRNKHAFRRGAEAIVYELEVVERSKKSTATEYPAPPPRPKRARGGRRIRSYPGVGPATLWWA
jgi:hypothetical protein